MPQDAPLNDGWEPALGRPLSDLVRERVLQAILSGRLQPGDRIVEMTLAKRLGVSRGSLREALRGLESQHIVETHHARGTFIAKISPRQMEQMSVTRAALEGMAARIVATNLQPSVLKELRRVHRAIVAAAKARRYDEWRALDLQFHETVCEQSGNQFLLNAWRAIRNLIWLFLHETERFEARSEAVLSNHERMIEAIASGDPNLAEATFRDAILGSATVTAMGPRTTS